jgi:hypothetical protein
MHMDYLIIFHCYEKIKISLQNQVTVRVQIDGMCLQRVRLSSFYKFIILEFLKTLHCILFLAVYEILRS